MGAYLVRCTGVDKDEAGNVVTIHAEADLETRNGNPADGRKVRGTIHWVSCEHCVDAEIHPVSYTHLTPPSAQTPQAVHMEWLDCVIAYF